MYDLLGPLKTFARNLIACTTAGAMVFTGFPSAVFPRQHVSLVAFAGEASETCRVESDSQFRNRVEEITLAALDAAVADYDFQAAVAAHWQKLSLDARIDRLVDEATDEVRSETRWSQLIATLANKEKARQVAQAVAERTYQSDQFKKAIEALAIDVGKGVAVNIERATSDAALPAMRCIREFLGSKYGISIARIVGADAESEFQPPESDEIASVGTGQIILEGREAIAGAVILLVRRTLARMARNVGARVVGAALSRIVSVIAGGIGLVLIAKDLWDLRHGVLPIIATEMKSAESKAKVRDVLASSISDQMGKHTSEIAAKIADRVLEVWHAFKQAHTKVLDLADDSPDFKAFIDTVSNQRMTRLDRVTALVLANEGEDGIKARLADGTLDDAVKRLPDPALEIAIDSNALQSGFDWNRLAGDNIAKVVTWELHRLAKPDEFTRQSLNQLVDLEDAVAIRHLARARSVDRNALLDLPPERLKLLAVQLSPQELSDLGAYLRALEPTARTHLEDVIVANPSLMRHLTTGRVRGAVLRSSDQYAAIDLLTRSTGPLDFLDLQSDFKSVIRGDVDPLLLWDSHPYAVIFGAIALLLLLLILRRLLFGRRRRRRG